MIKKIATLVLFLSCLSVKAQFTAEQIKSGLIGKEWKITKYEMFGVAEEPKENQVNDKIVLKEDMTFIVIENGKEYKGKWSIMNPSIYINCKATNWSKMYKILEIGESEAKIQYKDPDLIKTDYYLSAK